MRILIVEDDKKVAAFLRQGLEEEQYAVDVCHNGCEALETAPINDYDLIILDLMLPGINGLTVCRQLRQEGVQTPIIMLTARDGLQDKVTGLDCGADDYLTKPFSFEELLARMRAQLRRAQANRGGELTCGDLTLDPVKHQVSRAGRKIALTGKEYALLEYLLRNRGRIVSETRIIEHVWDMNYDGLSNVVSVHINRLRRKIDDGFSTKLLRTHRGHGYELEVQE